jgi:hypothetical protein
MYCPSTPHPLKWAFSIRFANPKTAVGWAGAGHRQGAASGAGRSLAPIPNPAGGLGQANRPRQGAGGAVGGCFMYSGTMLARVGWTVAGQGQGWQGCYGAVSRG